jgi:hypothetical protein
MGVGGKDPSENKIQDTNQAFPPVPRSAERSTELTPKSQVEAIWGRPARNQGNFNSINLGFTGNLPHLGAGGKDSSENKIQITSPTFPPSPRSAERSTELTPKSHVEAFRGYTARNPGDLNSINLDLQEISPRSGPCPPLAEVGGKNSSENQDPSYKASVSLISKTFIYLKYVLPIQLTMLHIPGYIPRNRYLKQIEPYIGSNLIKVLIGQRRVGKSYILFQLMDEIRKCDESTQIL